MGFLLFLHPNEKLLSHKNKFLLFFPFQPSLGGNLLVNAGPTAYGEITPIYEERLRQMGQWLGINGQAIYGTRPWTYQNDTTNTDVW